MKKNSENFQGEGIVIGHSGMWSMSRRPAPLAGGSDDSESGGSICSRVMTKYNGRKNLVKMKFVNSSLIIFYNVFKSLFSTKKDSYKHGGKIFLLKKNNCEFSFSKSGPFFDPFHFLVVENNQSCINRGSSGFFRPTLRIRSLLAHA